MTVVKNVVFNRKFNLEIFVKVKYKMFNFNRLWEILYLKT